MLEADRHGRRLDRSAQIAAVSDALADGAAAARYLARALSRTDADGDRTTNLACRSRQPTTIRWSARSGDLPNTGHGRRASCCTTAGSRRSIAQLSAPWRRDCLGRQRCKTSLSRTSCTITSKLSDRTSRSHGAISRHYSGSAIGIGEPALRRLPRSPPAHLRNRCSNLPCHPRVLDLVALDAISTDATAARIAARIVAIGR